MPKRTKSYRSGQLERLKDPAYAADYVNAAIEAGDDAALLLALRNVAESQTVNNVANQAGLSRESVYRMLSETGNPCYASLLGILGALGLQFKVQPAYKTFLGNEVPNSRSNPSLVWERTDRPSAYFSEKYAEFACSFNQIRINRESRLWHSDMPCNAPEFFEIVA